MSEKIIWKPLPDDENKRFNVLWGENSIHRDPIISVPYNILMPKYYEAISDQILNFEVRPDDIWIMTRDLTKSIERNKSHNISKMWNDLDSRNCLAYHERCKQRIRKPSSVCTHPVSGVSRYS